MWIGHRKETRKLTFWALALRRSESNSLRRRANARIMNLFFHVAQDNLIIGKHFVRQYFVDKSERLVRFNCTIAQLCHFTTVSLAENIGFQSKLVTFTWRAFLVAIG